MKVRWKKTGNWAEVGRLTRNLQKDLEMTQKAILKAWADKAMMVVKGHIEQQDLGWETLAAYTIERKSSLGRPYIDEAWRETNFLYKSIKKLRDDDTVKVGLPLGVRHPVSGAELSEIANTLEYGSWAMNIPERPLWEPSMQEMYQNLDQIIEDGIKYLAGRLRRYGVTPGQMSRI